MILAVRYQEPEYLKTIECLEKIKGVKIAFVERKPEGKGSLSEAINRGFREQWDGSEFVFIMTNIQFEPYLYQRLINGIKSSPNLAALCPCYESDHAFLRPHSFKYGFELQQVPFIEFTAPMVRAQCLKDFPLDEDMPYVGQDLDWSYRVKQAGFTLGVDYGTSLEHKYIRKSKMHPITKERLRLRKLADKPTIKKLETKYGKEWPTILQYKNGIASR